jgi:hypothetical protein
MIGPTAASGAAWAFASRAEVCFSLHWLLIFELGRASVFAASRSRCHQLKAEAEPPRNRSETEEIPSVEPTPNLFEIGDWT